ncbi:MAG: MoxR family ATPase [Phycisphaerales bacterium]|nr:MoxR family ATPase [Phycisphaerales bacterium]
MSEWMIFKGSGAPHDGIGRLPAPPPWRAFGDDSPAGDPERETYRGRTFHPDAAQIEMVNAALYLRRPLLITGDPGCGKSSLAYAVAWELGLGRVLRWSINSRSTLAEGLYTYDAVARLRDASMQHQGGAGGREAEDVGRYVRLGPLGTALYPCGERRPRVLLIDEIDKSDIDLPNDLLHVFEEGEYEIPELSRLEDRAGVEVMPWDGRGDDDRVTIRGGRVRCATFPFVVLTSNGERELPPAFHRRCLRLHIASPDPDHLRRIVESHLARLDPDLVGTMIEEFDKRRQEGVMATDQLLNALYLLSRPSTSDERTRDRVLHEILRDLGAS